VTREEVCQYLTLLRRLPDDLVKSLEAETRPEVLRTMSYRRLLTMARSAPRPDIASPTSRRPGGGHNDLEAPRFGRCHLPNSMGFPSVDNVENLSTPTYNALPTGHD
jgi:hypothetical protein